MKLNCFDVDTHPLMNVPLISFLQLSDFLIQRLHRAEIERFDSAEKEALMALIREMQSPSNTGKELYSVLRNFLNNFSPELVRFKKSEKWLKELICQEMRIIFSALQNFSVLEK